MDNNIKLEYPFFMTDEELEKAIECLLPFAEMNNDSFLQYLISQETSNPSFCEYTTDDILKEINATIKEEFGTEDIIIYPNETTTIPILSPLDDYNYSNDNDNLSLTEITKDLESLLNEIKIPDDT
ncbi:uncharacterized protein SAPINGB_P005213 [Magnusiomyces paraingens]|uniref:Uncharacterized protein n=1 Tax=Magnusiomyces paraingens TaxID=2606893 RepID=A0A5E8BZ20_9ASCO|nr:uncharacterized protein SAPINGB_P005213 [Saprochaete ingens]VVT56684.1 unnamed protein product [Saprochaete ingens]